MAYFRKTPQFMEDRNKEDEIIINYLKKYPTNLAYAFNQAAIEIGVTEMAISGRYYQRIKKDLERPVIATGSEKGLVINTKNTHLKSDTSNDVRLALLKAVFTAIPFENAIDMLLNNLTNTEQQGLLERMISKLKSA